MKPIQNETRKSPNRELWDCFCLVTYIYIYILYPFLGFRLRIGNREYGTKKKESCLKWELEWNPTKASYLISSCPSLDFWVFSTCLFNSCIFHVSGATMWLRGRLGQAECRPSFQKLLVHQKVKTQLYI